VEILLEVLKWVAIVFVAGAIGQFGKSLTLKILENRRRKAAAVGEAPAPAGPTPGAAGLTKEEAKAAKKARKAEAKRRKKSQG
jgi:hypothetical protein